MQCGDGDKLQSVNPFGAGNACRIGVAPLGRLPAARASLEKEKV
jgi:hypothetical protein